MPKIRRQNLPPALLHHLLDRQHELDPTGEQKEAREQPLNNPQCVVHDVHHFTDAHSTMNDNAVTRLRHLEDGFGPWRADTFTGSRDSLLSQAAGLSIGRRRDYTGPTLEGSACLHGL